MGVLDLEFPQGTDKSLFLESAYLLCYGLLKRRKMMSFGKESLIEFFLAHKSVLQDFLVHVRMVQSALTNT